MKINFKHVATAALAVAMSLSLASPALAEVPEATPTPVTSGDLTVTGDQLIGKNVTAVRMFTARAINNGGNDNPDYGYDSYTLEDGWLDFFQSATYFSVDDYNGVSENVTVLTDVTADDALAYTQALTDTTEIAAFAHNAQKWYRENTKDSANAEIKEKLVALTTNKEAVSVKPDDATETKGTVTFKGLISGYYLVFPEGGSTGDNIQGTETPRNTDAMLINIPTNHEGATWNIKSTYPTVDKKVDTNETVDDTHGDATDNGSAQVGDTVTFTLKSTVPDMSDYTTFYFAFNDTLSDGLKVVDNAGNDVVDGNNLTINGLTVTIDGENVSGYTVSLHDNVLKVEFTDLKSVGQANQSEDIGKAIVVTYQAKITEAAVSGSGNIVGNAQNDVYLEYSNNPSTTDKGTSTPDTSKVYTYDIDVDKYELVKDTTDSDGDTNKEEMIEKGLADAKFVLSKDETLTDNGSGVYTNAIGISTVSGQNNTYKVDPTSDTYEFMTVANGDITIEGLEAGIYYLHEVAAPNGYNKLANPLKIEIIVDKETAATYAPAEDPGKYNDVSFEKPLYVVDEKPNATNNDTIKVLNKKGITLPETGGIGTIGLTVAGVAIVLLGVFAPRKKKKSNQE